MEGKINKFREQYLKPKEMIPSKIELEKIINKNTDIYFKNKLEKEFFPFLDKFLEKIILHFLKTNEIKKYKNLQILNKIYKKIKVVIKTNKERKEILGSDYATESEDENDIRNIFSKEELFIFDQEGVNLNSMIQSNKNLKNTIERLKNKNQLKTIRDFL